MTVKFVYHVPSEIFLNQENCLSVIECRASRFNGLKVNKEQESNMDCYNTMPDD